ncbi:hypothetical protein DIC66_17095 [Rhodoferax lacus]|uniref:Uncharacterized protein n=1 Tax=Rhodoferax lacus TaxID=2184758 RepID=A0A3E1RAN0_9BURK|nr:hypothetical protein DIC66_17095 [Rhodoferax lacus]
MAHMELNLAAAAIALTAYALTKLNADVADYSHPGCPDAPAVLQLAGVKAPSPIKAWLRVRGESAIALSLALQCT